MNGVKARLAAIAASYVAAMIASAGVAEITPEIAAELEQWLTHTFELTLFVGYALIHPLLRRKMEERRSE